MTPNKQEELEGFEPNRERYRKLAKPFASVAECNAALNEFRLDLDALREKHGIQDVVGALSGSFLDGEGEETDYIVPMQHGDAMKGEGLAAWLYGFMARGREAAIAGMLKQGKSR